MSRMLWNYKVTVSVGDVMISSREAPFWSDWRRDLEEVMSAHSKDFSQRLIGLSEGGTVSIDIPNVRVAVECILNRPAPRRKRRPPDVIAAEKQAKAEAKAAAVAAYKAQQEGRRKAAEHQALLHRTRITHQIDYAFKSGPESGSEPVAKFITCQSCDAPAEFLQLNREVPRGAAVLDESTIMGAICSEHNHGYWGHSGVVQTFPCSQLEFFYSGIRQIGIKAANP